MPHACSILHITERSCSSMFYGHVKLTSVSIANEAVWCVVRTETLSPPVACTHILTLHNIPCGPLCLPSPYQCILQGSAKGERWPKTFTNHRTNTIKCCTLLRHICCTFCRCGRVAGRGAREGSLGTNRPPLWYDPAAQLSSRTITRSDKMGGFITKPRNKRWRGTYRLKVDV